MESKKCRKVPIILYDGSLVKKDPGSGKYKCDQPGGENQLIPIKINFINSSGKNGKKSKITSSSEASNCVELKIDLMSSQASGEEVKKVPIMSCSPHNNRDKHTGDHNGDQYSRNQLRCENETLAKMHKDKIDVKDKTVEEQNSKINPRLSSSIDWKLTQKSPNHIYKDLEVHIFITNEWKSVCRDQGPCIVYRYNDFY